MLQSLQPDLPAPMASARWDAITPASEVSGDRRRTILAVTALMQHASHSRAFERLLADNDAPVTQPVFATLDDVVAHGPSPVTVIAARTGVDHTQASKRIQQLVDLGMAARVTDPSDRRRALAHATPEGLRWHQHICAIQVRDLRAAVGPTTPDERARWTPLVLRLADAVRAAGLEGEGFSNFA